MSRGSHCLIARRFSISRAMRSMDGTSMNQRGKMPTPKRLSNSEASLTAIIESRSPFAIWEEEIGAL